MDLLRTLPDEQPEVARFLLKVFNLPPTASFVTPELMRWKYFDPRPDWTGSRSYVMKKDGLIFAHGCVVPETFLTPQGRVTSMRVIDWAGGRAVPASGVLMMRKLAELTDTVLAIGGSPQTVAVLPKIGFRHQGDLDVYVRVVRPWRQFRTDPFPRGWKAPLRLARNTLWSLPALPSVPAGWSAERVEKFDGAIVPALSFVPRQSITTERTPEMLNYMLDCPGARFAGFLLRRRPRERPCGYFILSQVHGQTRICEVRLDSEDPADWRSAYALATRAAARLPGTCEILAVSSIEAGRAALALNGYRFRRHETIFVFDPRHKLEGLSELNLNLIAGDESYLYNAAYPFES